MSVTLALSAPQSVATPVHAPAAPVQPMAVAASKAILVPYSVVNSSNVTERILCSDCGIKRSSSTEATAVGMLATSGLVASDVVRQVKLQRLSGTTWSTIATADAGVDGMVSFTFSIATAPRWTPRSYRLYAPAAGGSSSLTSATTKFLPGPGMPDSTSYPLGNNVLRVSVNNTVYPTSKTTIYKGSLTYTTAAGAITRVPLENFAVRGGTTAKLAKKPYKLKFESKLDPFDPTNGTNGASSQWRSKRFNLLALFVDNTLMRDRVGLDLARRQDGNGTRTSDIPTYLAKPGLKWTSRAQYTELFVNDQYMGVYLITDANKIDDRRVTISKTQGAIVEADGPKVSSDAIEWKTAKGGYNYIKFEDPDSYKNLVTGAEKVGYTAPTWPAAEFDPEAITVAKRDAVRAKVQRLENAIYARDWTEIQKYLDVDSTVDWYLVREFTKDVDADFYRSADFYLPDYMACPAVPADGTTCEATGKFYFGPVWDFDRSAGATTKSTAIASTSGFYVAGTSPGYSSRAAQHTSQWFYQLTRTPGFMTAVKARWAIKKAEYKAVGDADVDAMYARLVGDPGAIDARAGSDRMRWAGFAREYGARSSTFAGEKAFVKSWFQGRYNWINANL